MQTNHSRTNVAKYSIARFTHGFVSYLSAVMLIARSRHYRMQSLVTWNQGQCLNFCSNLDLRNVSKTQDAQWNNLFYKQILKLRIRFNVYFLLKFSFICHFVLVLNIFFHQKYFINYVVSGTSDKLNILKNQSDLWRNFFVEIVKKMEKLK